MFSSWLCMYLLLHVTFSLAAILKVESRRTFFEGKGHTCILAPLMLLAETTVFLSEGKQKLVYSGKHNKICDLFFLPEDSFQNNLL